MYRPYLFDTKLIRHYHLPQVSTIKNTWKISALIGIFGLIKLNTELGTKGCRFT